ncbi:MAG: phosphopyruvate hydratase [Patescibacteria group bacterium]|nr:phosphopyruvate hydratase [Patescibacteria group bacterium]
MPAIKGVYAREILDSRGIPTVECTVWLDSGGIVVTSVPAGTSIGKYEALELRDQDESRFVGKGVLKAVENINLQIAPKLIGQDPTQQGEIDQMMIQLDGTPNKSSLGANAIMAVSQAVLKAGALSQNLPLYYYVWQKFGLCQQLAIPKCVYTIISGGEHGAGNLDIQEFQIIPASHIDFTNSLNLAVTMFQKLEEVLVIKGAIRSVGLLGGFTPNLYSNTDAFEILIETTKATPYTFGQDLFFGIDAAAASFYENGVYKLKDRSEGYSAKELLDYYKSIKDLYHVFYMEDPFREDDTDMWKQLTKEIGETTRVIGDSLLATNKEKTLQAIADKTCNSILVKPNQVGTISETIEVIKIARNAGWEITVSHRSGETNDDLIVDLAVGVGAESVKFGPPNRGERLAKYNRMLQIDDELKRWQSQKQTQAKPVKSTLL